MRCGRRRAAGRCSRPVWPGWFWGSSDGLPPSLRPQAVVRFPSLTPRETEVLKLVATGMSCKQIGSHLFTSRRTAQNHVQNTLNKLQRHNRVELARVAIARGLDATA